MAQPKFDICSIALSKKIGDEVSSSSTNGDIWSANDRLEAINRARHWIYSEFLTRMGETQFMNLFPEFVGKKENVVISPAKAADIRKVIKLYISSVIIEAVPSEAIMDAKHNSASPWFGTATKPRFAENGDAIEIIGADTPGTATALYLIQPVDIAGIGGANVDLIEPYNWLQHIIEKAFDIIMKDNNNS